VEYLAGSLIRILKPDIVHSLVFQNAGYLSLAAKETLGRRFPTWVVTNWGSDIYLYGRLKEHREKIAAILATCGYYACECQGDVRLAKEMELARKVLPVLPNTGGFDLAYAAALR
jgi:hypothetical protein